MASNKPILIMGNTAARGSRELYMHARDGSGERKGAWQRVLRSICTVIWVSPRLVSVSATGSASETLPSTLALSVSGRAGLRERVPTRAKLGTRLCVPCRARRRATRHGLGGKEGNMDVLKMKDSLKMRLVPSIGYHSTKTAEL
jgi:hypothetical protein